MRYIIILLLISSTSFGQKKEKGVTLKIFNNTKQQCLLKVFQQANQADEAVKEFVTQGNSDSVAIGTSISINLPEIKRGFFLNVYAELGKGGRTSSVLILVEKNKKEYQVPVDIPSGRVVAGGDAEAIKSAMRYEPTKFMITENYPLADLFNGLFGGLVIYKQETGRIIVKNTITPVQLGTRVDNKFGGNSDKKTTVISKEQSAAAKLSIPSIAGLSLDWSSADLFKLDVIYKGAGPILWSPTPEMIDVVTKFKILPNDRLYFIGELYDNDTTLKMAQIDNAYVYEAISFDLLKYSKLTTNSTVDANAFFAASGNYMLSNEESQKQVIGSFMQGAWWNNDYTPLLSHARKIYLDEKEKQLVEAKNVQDIRNLYNSLRISNPDLPEFTTKDKAIEEIKRLKQSIKVHEEEIKKNPEISISPSVNTPTNN